MGNTKARGIRINTETEQLIEQRATHKGWSFNRWINWAITLGLRSHRKKGQSG